MERICREAPKGDDKRDKVFDDLLADVCTDVYATGAMLFEALSGKPPFSADSVPTLLYKIVHQEAPPLHALQPDLPQAVSQVVARALAKRPAQRQRDMAELAQQLAAAADGEVADEVEQPDTLEDDPPTVAPVAVQITAEDGQHITAYMKGPNADEAATRPATPARISAAPRPRARSSPGGAAPWPWRPWCRASPPGPTCSSTASR